MYGLYFERILSPDNEYDTQIVIWHHQWPTEGRPPKLDDRRSAPKNWSTEGRPPKIGRPKVGPQKLEDRRSAPKNWRTEGRPPKIGGPKVVP